MIIGENRIAVIENIKRAAESGDFYAKVELNDPVLTDAESKQIVENYLSSRPKASYKIKSNIARTMADGAMFFINKDTEIVGAEKLTAIKGGAIITSNHFSPIENTIVRYTVRKCLQKRLAIVSQVTNFAMTGIIGFLMNYANTIPLSNDRRYMARSFTDILEERINKDEIVLIYPEQEMWFNYRKPRPPKRGAYHFAAKLNVPLISCFVEMIDAAEKDTDEFYKVKYRIHILEVLMPDSTRTAKENSTLLCDTDYKLKTEAYERLYGKRLDYTFEESDIAGWINEE